jgi:Flp pilus assembly protein TadB
MTGPPGKPGFREIYRQQYRQVSKSRTGRVFAVITPLVLLAVAVLALHAPAQPTVLIVLGALAVICFATAVVLSRRQRRGPDGSDRR